MFSNSQSATDFLRESFPELLGKFLFAVLLKKKGEEKSEIVLFFNSETLDADKNIIKNFIKRFPEISEVSFSDAGLTLLTEPIILREIKIHQPLDYKALFERLKGTQIFFEEIELKRLLDKLRKAKKIIRSSSGKYAVTELALGLIPHGNYRNSSDIQRLLELGRRK